VNRVALKTEVNVKSDTSMQQNGEINILTNCIFLKAIIMSQATNCPLSSS
jgi:hypothetical protein